MKGPSQNKNLLLEFLAEHPDVVVWTAVIAVPSLLILGGLILWNRQLGKEIALRQATEKTLKVILDNLAIGVLFAKDRKLLWVNSRFAEIFGYGMDEVESKDAGMLYPDIESYLKVGEGYAVLAKGENYAAECRMKRKDGTLFWAKIVGQAVNPNNDAEGSIWLIEDITERRQMEEDLHALNQRLEQRVQEETLKRMDNERMLIHQSKLAAMGEMLGAIAHQWRQPLNTMGLIVQDVQDAYECGALNKEYLGESTRRAMQQVSFMSKTIDDFRGFFRPDKEKIVFDAAAAVGEVLRLLAGQLKACNISCRLEVLPLKRVFECDADVAPCSGMEVCSYRGEFAQVLLNIISNAKDAILEKRSSDPGAKDQKGVIDIVADRVGEKIVLKISDNGGGIPEAALDRIFEPYFTTKEPGKGTGIGLYMSKMIIEQNAGGRLYAVNGGEGAVFAIELQGNVIMT